MPGRAPLRVLYGQVLTLIAVVLLGTAVALVVLGAVRHQRTQTVAEGQLRLSLAEGTAPVSQLDPGGAPLAPGTPVALLAIPSIDLREVVFEGTAGQVLAEGPGHRRDTVLPGQAGVSVLMGRRAGYGGPFGRVPDLRVDDEITVTTGQGVHRYAVTGVRHAGDPQPEAPEPGTGTLILTTADGLPFLPDDVVRVDAKLTTPVMPTPARAFGVAQLPAGELAMGEGDDVVPLIFWLQLLIALGCGVVYVRARLGAWHAWIVGVPTLATAGLGAADAALRLLPNLL
ncbi:sortase [Catellatospora sp. KI3]|uniref:sortase domain-containing protein n=1 Tax=Catellatospora sp. KI3 TaxID=3041620 RepID=UPI002482E5B4|nr:sortase [Catellatospora sp. KI3]MDI1465855.1 sortase [Catellatospora sp. KI3]